MAAELIKNVAKEQIFSLSKLVEVEEEQVVSLTLSQMPGCKVTVFAIDANEGMASHAAGGDALVTVLEGTGEITINGVPHTLEAGESVVIPAGAPHAVQDAARGRSARVANVCMSVVGREGGFCPRAPLPI